MIPQINRISLVVSIIIQSAFLGGYRVTHCHASRFHSTPPEAPLLDHFPTSGLPSPPDHFLIQKHYLNLCLSLLSLAYFTIILSLFLFKNSVILNFATFGVVHLLSQFVTVQPHILILIQHLGLTHSLCHRYTYIFLFL